MIDFIQLRMVIEVIAALAVWPFLLGIFLIVGSRQSREGRGTAGRLWFVSMMASTLASLPMLIWIISLLPPYSVETGFWFHLGLTVVSAAGVSRYLTSAVPKWGGGVRLSSVRDPDVLKRVDDLSVKLGIAPPVVSHLDSPLNPPELAVVAGGLSAPMLILIGSLPGGAQGHDPSYSIANGLASIRTGEFWWKAAMTPMAAVATSFASAFVSIPVAIGCGLVFYFFFVCMCVPRWSKGRSVALARDVLESEMNPSTAT